MKLPFHGIGHGAVADLDVARLLSAALATTIGWALVVALFGGFSHVDALRAGRDSAIASWLGVYGTGFAPWLFLGPAVFFVTRRYSGRMTTRATRIAFAATLFFAAFGVIFVYFITVYASVTQMTAAEAVASARLVEWVPDIFLFLIVFVAGLDRNATEPAAGAPARLAIKSQGRVDYVRVADISHGEACGNYIEISADGRTYLYRGSMKKLCAMLGSDRVVRIHRSFIVNLDYVASAKTNGARIRELVLNTGRTVPVGAQYEDTVRSALVENAVA